MFSVMLAVKSNPSVISKHGRVTLMIKNFKQLKKKTIEGNILYLIALIFFEHCLV